MAEYVSTYRASGMGYDLLKGTYEYELKIWRRVERVPQRPSGKLVKGFVDMLLE